MPRHQRQCLPVVLICLRKPRLHTRHMNGLGKRHSVSLYVFFLLAVLIHNNLWRFFFTELDKNWLVDAAYAANKVGMMVKIRGSRGDSGGFPEWDHGKHESREGKLQGVLDTGSDYIPRTATLLMDDQDSLTVPIIYLVPIPPRLVRDKVVALDGRYKGQIVTVRDMMHDSCLVTHDDSMYDDLTHDRMCLYSDH